MKHLARLLGRRAVHATVMLHVTVAESSRVKQALAQRGFTWDDVRKFYGELQHDLSEDQGAQNGLTLEVDPGRPLQWYGRRRDCLALNLLPSEQLQRERSHVLGFLTRQLGGLPGLKQLRPHVVIARVDPRAIGPEAQRDPTVLLPEGAAIPASVVMGGLAVIFAGPESPVQPSA